MNPRLLSISIPEWVDHVVSEFAAELPSAEEQMNLAIRLSLENVERGGSPFGAAVFAGPRLMAAGVNCVLATGLSIAHAEIVTLMRAQTRLAQDHLAPLGPYTLVTSAEPCCQCFGALIWSGVSGVICGAATPDVEAVGFDEGPKPQPWGEALARHGIWLQEGVCRDEARAVLNLYSARGGPIYGRRQQSLVE
jgi:tRNA(Arg) A34 adenosine deaminase TadA